MKILKLLAIVFALLHVGFLSVESANSQSVADQVRDLSYNEEIQAYFVNATIIHYSPQTGTRVAFFASPRTVFFWTPGREQIARGRWRATPLPGQGPVFCADFGDADCYDLYVLGQSLTERLQGDVFGLSRGSAVPAVIPDGRRYSSTELRRLAGR